MRRAPATAPPRSEGAGTGPAGHALKAFDQASRGTSTVSKTWILSPTAMSG